MIYDFEDLRFKILNVGRYVHKGGTYDINARPNAALSYRVSGGGVFNIAGVEITVDVGDVVFIPENTPYRVDYIAGESIVVHFTDCNYSIPEKVSFKESAGVGMKFVRMLENWSDGASVNAIKSRVYDIFSCFEKERDSLANNTDIAECLGYVKERFTDPDLTVDSLCTRFHVSRSSLQRRFNEIMGVNPKKYVTDLRMKYAVDLLITESIPISEVACASGYRDEKYFSRIFKEKYGCTPTDMREIGKS